MIRFKHKICILLQHFLGFLHATKAGMMILYICNMFLLRLNQPIYNCAKLCGKNPKTYFGEISADDWYAIILLASGAKK